jgi:hypothetical protein
MDRVKIIRFTTRGERVNNNKPSMVRAFDCQCQSFNSPGFDPSILRRSGIWWAADEAVFIDIIYAYAYQITFVAIQGIYIYFYFYLKYPCNGFLSVQCAMVPLCPTCTSNVCSLFVFRCVVTVQFLVYWCSSFPVCTVYWLLPIPTYSVHKKHPILKAWYYIL